MTRDAASTLRAGMAAIVVAACAAGLAAQTTSQTGSGSGPGSQAATPSAPARQGAPPSQVLKAGARVYAIQGAKIITLAGAPIERGTVLIEDGRIKAVGASVSVPAGTEVLDATGLEVYPGLFDSVSELGLTEIDSVTATNDITEVGAFNPQLVAATAVHPPSEHIPVARANGLTHAIAVPGLGGTGSGQGPVIGGQASAIHLNGWTVEEMLVRASVALSVNWPTIGRTSSRAGGGPPSRRSRTYAQAKKAYEQKLRDLEDWIERARRYQQATAQASAARGSAPGSAQGATGAAPDATAGVGRDLRLEALVPVVTGELPLLVGANAARDIRHAVEFCEKHKLKIIIAGGADAYLLTDFLAKKGVPVILGPTQALPTREDEPYDVRNTTPGVLAKAGVTFALATFNSADSRTLPYEIGNAVSYGLPHEEALKAITLSPARIFGLADRLGSIEAGKIANLIVTTGDPLEYRTDVRYLFINGQPASLENKHHQLYEKWRARPRPAGTAPTTAAK